MSTPQRWSLKNNLQKQKKQLALQLTQSNQMVGVDLATRIHALNFLLVISSVEKKKKKNYNDDDDDRNINEKRKIILNMYEQCECKM